jgi:hypothetical protein
VRVIYFPFTFNRLGGSFTLDDLDFTFFRSTFVPAKAFIAAIAMRR